MRLLRIALCLVALGGSVAAQGQYVKVAEIPVGGTASFDYLNVDSAAHRLYLTNSTQVVVIDTVTNVVVGKIPAGPGVHGIAIAPDGRGYITNGGDDTVNIVDLKTLQLLGKVSTKGPDASVRQNPDAICYEPKQKEIYAFNHSGKSVTVIDSAGKAIAQIPLSGTAESGQADPVLGRVFVNIEDTDSIDVIDIATHKVVANWKVAPASSPTGMAIDTATHRLFIGGGPNTVMIDATSGKVLASAPIIGGTDATWFDAATQMVFSSGTANGGAITVMHVDGPTALRVVQTLVTAPRARTMALDVATHRLYVAAQKYAPVDGNAAAPPPPPAGAGRGRAAGPPAIPGSFHVIAFAMSK
ncbi:MAG: YncE family protein [Vicinamibacterales bacterium]